MAGQFFAAMRDEAQRQRLLRLRNRVEEIVGWTKTAYIGIAKHQRRAQITGAAFDLVHMARLERAVTQA